jgi:hypothetical protein
MSLTPPPAARLAALARLKSTVLQLPYNPLGLRTGLHYLTKPLRGPEVAAWYPVRLDDRVTKTVLKLPEEWKSERWTLWNEARERRLAKGKKPVKKGQSCAVARLFLIPRSAMAVLQLGPGRGGAEGGGSRRASLRGSRPDRALRLLPLSTAAQHRRRPTNTHLSPPFQARAKRPLCGQSADERARCPCRYT